jgi:predicted nuclease of predicted toxin-antitoxin system
VIRLLIDADLPRSACAALRQRGHVAEDVRDLDLSAATDATVLHYATTHGYTLLSADKGFSNLLRFPLGTHHGIIVSRFPRHTSARDKVRLLLRWMSVLQEEEIDGNLLILEPKGVRIRRAK